MKLLILVLFLGLVSCGEDTKDLFFKEQVSYISEAPTSAQTGGGEVFESVTFFPNGECEYKGSDFISEGTYLIKEDELISENCRNFTIISDVKIQQGDVMWLLDE